jgi:ankyrin repeat protein
MEDLGSNPLSRSFHGKDCEQQTERCVDRRRDLNPRVDPVAERLHDIAERLGIYHTDYVPSELLFSAIKLRKLGIVKELLEQFHVDGNGHDHMGRTPLSQALGTGYVEMIEYLLTNKMIQVDAADKDGLTPLWRALKGATHFQKLQIPALLIRKVNVDTLSDKGEHLLFWTIKNRGRLATHPWGQYEGFPTREPEKSFLSLLLERKDLNVNQVDSEGCSALFLAVKAGKQTAVKDLLERDDIEVNSFDKDHRTPLSLAAEICDHSMVKTLLDCPNVDVWSRDKNGRTPLFWSIENDKVESMKLLLARGNQAINSTDNCGRTPLSWAAEKGSLETVEVLLDCAGVDTDKKDNGGRTPLSWAAENNLQRPRIREEGSYSLQEDVRIVELLIKTEGVDNNSKDNSDRTPLSWATREGNEKVMRKLIKKDTDTLHTLVSTQPEQPERVKLLIDAGYDPCQLDPRGRIPLHDAVLAQSIESAKLLISRDPASINRKDNNGIAPLSLAVTESPVLAKMLVEKGATTDDIQPSMWFNGNKNSMASIVCLSKQHSTQRLQYLARDNFEEKLAKPLPSGMRLLYVGYYCYPPDTWVRLMLKENSLCKSSPPPWENGSLLGFKKSLTDVNLRMDMLLYSDPSTGHRRHHSILETSFPGSFNPWYLKKAEEIDSRETTISCVAIQHMKSSPGPGTQSADFLSTLPHSKIPEDGAEFVIQFLSAVETRWSTILTRAEKHIRERVSVYYMIHIWE